MMDRPKIELTADLRASILGLVGMVDEMVANGLTRTEAIYMATSVIAKEGVVLMPPKSDDYH